MRKKLKTVSMMACQSIFALSLTACSGDTNKQAISNPVPVLVGEVQKVQESETIFVSGTVATPVLPADVSFLVSGKVVFVGPREGDYVAKDLVLAQIDPTDFRLRLKSAEEQKAKAHAAMEKALQSARPEVLEQARIAYWRAEDEYRRKKMLYDSNSLAPNDFTKFKAAYETAKQKYEEAKAGAQKQEKDLYRAEYDQAEAQRQLAAKALSDATLHAPVSGYISKRLIEPGDTASAYRPVFEIVQLDTVEVQVGVPETDFHAVKIGQEASITFPALPNRSFQGSVRIKNVAADPGTRTYMTRISLPNAGHVIRIGMVAEARIITDRKISIMTVPGRAIVRDSQGATIVFVYFPKERRVYSKRVEAGTLYGTEVEIKEGLSGDESIVIGGQDHLRDGMPVTIATPPSENASDRKRR